MKIFDLTFTVRNPDVPFKVESHETFSSGDIVWVLTQFQLHLIKVLKDIHEKEILDIRMENDDIPF